MRFKEFLGEDTWLNSPNPVHLRNLIADVSLMEAQMLIQGKEPAGKDILIGDKATNVLVPYGPWKVHDKNVPSSGFLRDQPALASYALANPENLASVLIFVLLTIRADFQQVMVDFPSVMAKLFTKFSKPGEDLTDDTLSKEIDAMHIRLSQQANPGIFDNDLFAKGYALKTTTFGFKNTGVAEVWNNRKRYFEKVKKFADKQDPEEMFRYLTNNVTGLGPAKAGFCVQIIMGKLGCIDMHNINLYSQYAKHYGKKKLYNALEPKKYAGKSKKQIEHYLRVLEMLAKDGATTMKLWDYWTNYVAHNYVSNVTGRSKYDATNAFAGHSVDPNEELPQKFAAMGPIEDRAGDKSQTFNWGTNVAANRASRDHRIISQYRNKQYWYDILQGLEDRSKWPDESRFRTPNPKDTPHKALAYIVTGPGMAEEMGLSQEFVKRAKDALQRASVLTGKNFLYPGKQKPLFTPLAMGKSHKPVRTKAEKSVIWTPPKPELQQSTMF